MTSRPSRRASKSWGGAQRRVVRHGVQARSAATDRGGEPIGVSSRRQGDNRRGGGRDMTVVIKTRSVTATGAAELRALPQQLEAHTRGGGEQHRAAAGSGPAAAEGRFSNRAGRHCIGSNRPSLGRRGNLRSSCSGSGSGAASSGGACPTAGHARAAARG